jgi:hypothetical protein
MCENIARQTSSPVESSYFLYKMHVHGVQLLQININLYIYFRVIHPVLRSCGRYNSKSYKGTSVGE